VPQAALNPFAADPFFRYFFQQFGGRELAPRPEKSLGSGEIVRADGLIVTNYHVVEDADEIMAASSERREFGAHLVGGHQAADLALLGIDADHLPSLPMGDSDALDPGDLVTAVGGQPAESVDQSEQLLRKAGPPWRLEIERDGSRWRW
jgi:S1-C subfamily serine protease